MDNYKEIQELLHQRADANTRLRLIPYEGTPEIKERGDNKYLYMRKRVGSRVSSQYIDIYSDILYETLLRNGRDARELRKNIRHIEKKLAELGYSSHNLDPDVLLNIDFARANMKLSIYEQAVLEGVATTYPQTEEIVENGKVNGMNAQDVQKILNLKHAWEFILDEDVVQFPSDFDILSNIARIVNEGFFDNGGRVRGVPVSIHGTSYVPPLPFKSVIVENIADILSKNQNPIDTAIQLCLYCMRSQIFIDGNKRASILLANHYLVSHGAGMMVVPENAVPKFKELLIEFYESNNLEVIAEFMRKECWKNYK